MAIVLGEYFPEEFVFGMVDCFDDVLIIAREVEEATTFAGRSKLGQNVFAGEGHEVVGGIEAEFRSQVSEHPWRIVLELEIVLRGGNQFVSSTN